MALSFLSSSGNASHVKYFEIRLDESNLILKGNRDEASSTLLTGKLILCLSEPLRVQDIHMRFRGHSRIGFPTAQNVRAGYAYVKQEREFWRKNWTFVNPGRGHSEILPPGNYEYPFEAVLPGDIPESVEGLSDSWIIYRMKATIDRGLLATNVYARKHVRVVRTFDPSALELAHAMSIENIWSNKIEYCISTPSKGVIFGCPIAINFSLIPHLKGLKIGHVVSELVESQEMTTDQIPQSRKEHQSTRTVAKDEYQLPEDTQTEEINGQDGYVFTRVVHVPKSLRQCMQTVDVAGFRIKHRLKFVVNLINPDDHKSEELRATLPIHIFISPNLPLNENNDIVNQTPQTAQGVENLAHGAPPVYGEHQFDQLYGDIDPSGYITPAVGSGISTPFNSQSRSNSTENLSTLNNLSPNVLSMTALHHQLDNVPNSGPSRLTEHRAGIAGADAGTASNRSDMIAAESSVHHNREMDPSSHDQSHASSRRISGDVQLMTGIHASQHIELSDEDLSKVPSYGTALQTPAGTPFSESLPTYQKATNQPPRP